MMIDSLALYSITYFASHCINLQSYHDVLKVIVEYGIAQQYLDFSTLQNNFISVFLIMKTHNNVKALDKYL